MLPSTPPNLVWVRRWFFGGWCVAAVVIVLLLIVTAGHPLPGGPTYRASYIGSKVPTGTNFTFIFSETISLYALNVTSTSSSGTATVVIFGNWSASQATSVSTSVGGLSPSCPEPWGCWGTPGASSGSLDLSVTVSTNLASQFGGSELTVALVFWSISTDTVTATSPIFAVVAG